MKIKFARITVVLFLLFLVSCGNQSSDSSKDDDTPYKYEDVKAEDIASVDSYNITETTAIEETADTPNPHADILQSIKNDASLLAHIEAVVGAPLHFSDNPAWGLPVITVLTSHIVVLTTPTIWAQTLTVFLRPDHTTSNESWIFEAYDISSDGIVLVEPIILKGAEQRISDSETFIARIYYEGSGEGMHGAWDDGFNFSERVISSENWAKDMIQHIHEVTGIVIRDIWLDENVLYIKQSPIEAFLPWGPASYRRVLLYLTGASLPGVEYVFLTDVKPGPFRCNQWVEIDEYFGFFYAGRKVLRGHHWAWVGPGVAEKADAVLEFFEQKLYDDLSLMAEQINYTSGGEARLYYLFVGDARGIGGTFAGGIHHSDRMFYRVLHGELWLDGNGDHVKRVDVGWFYVCVDFSEIFWISEADHETLEAVFNNDVAKYANEKS